MQAPQISPPQVDRRRRSVRESTGIRVLDDGWGDVDLDEEVEPVVFLDLDPVEDSRCTNPEVETLIELDIEPDPETDTFMMVDLVFDEDSHPAAKQPISALLEAVVPKATTGAPRSLARPRKASRRASSPPRRRGCSAPVRTNPSQVVIAGREMFPAAMSDTELAQLINHCTEELCGYW